MKMKIKKNVLSLRREYQVRNIGTDLNLYLICLISESDKSMRMGEKSVNDFCELTIEEISEKLKACIAQKSSTTEEIRNLLWTYLKILDF